MTQWQADNEYINYYNKLNKPIDDYMESQSEYEDLTNQNDWIGESIYNLNSIDIGSSRQPDLRQW